MLLHVEGVEIQSRVEGWRHFENPLAPQIGLVASGEAWTFEVDSAIDRNVESTSTSCKQTYIRSFKKNTFEILPGLVKVALSCLVYIAVHSSKNCTPKNIGFASNTMYTTLPVEITGSGVECISQNSFSNAVFSSKPL